MKQTISQTNLLKIPIQDNSIYIGGTQYWYEDSRQRLSGCGPTAASNIMWYLIKSNWGLNATLPIQTNDKDDFINLMQDMYQYITPSSFGVHKSSIFLDGLLRYGADHGIPLKSNVLEIPMFFHKRPSLTKVSDFLLSALSNDIPVAFLNLSNGTLQSLDSWHWVTILSWDSNHSTISFSDQGQIKSAPFDTWLKTTLLGGALISTQLDF